MKCIVMKTICRQHKLKLKKLIGLKLRVSNLKNLQPDQKWQNNKMIYQFKDQEIKIIRL